MAERHFLSKKAKILDDLERTYNPEKITTFCQLKESWLQNWSISVKLKIIEREKTVIRRLGEIIGDDGLLSKITPMLMRDSLMTYALMYDASHSTMTHIKSTYNKIFNHSSLYNVIPYAPMSVVKINTSIEKREAKFLELHELAAFLKL